MSEPLIGAGTIYGVQGEHRTPYLTRIWIGRLRIHLFHRGDADPDPHDHPWAFATFPLTSYVEEIFDPQTGDRRRRVVRSFRWHYRRAEFAHRVIGPARRSSGKILTIVWRGAGGRKWGFWRVRRGEQCWIPWRRYVFEGGKDAPCGEAPK